MIILPNTTDKLQLISSAAGELDVIAHFAEVDGTAPPIVQNFGRQLTNIVTATTTDILAAPTGTKVRNLEEMSIRNSHATISNIVTLIYNANSVLYEIRKATLLPGETLDYIRGIGWYQTTAGLNTIRNQSVADQALAAGTETYLNGSMLDIPPNRPLVAGARFHWRMSATKTAAGTAAWGVLVRFGTLGTTGDTARLTFTHGSVGTAAIDTATWEVRVIVRGPISSACIVAGAMEFQHKNDVTGFSILRVDAASLVSAAFDITTVTKVGLSYLPGASSIVTFQVVNAELENN